MRTPRREQMSRRRERKAVSTSTARSSPSISVMAVKPETSTKAKLRCTRTPKCSHVSRPPAQSRSLQARDGGRWSGPPTMAPWRRRGTARGKGRPGQRRCLRHRSGHRTPTGRRRRRRGDRRRVGRRRRVSGRGGRPAPEGGPSALLCDVRREESVAGFVERAVAEFGTVDAVDHNAAWSHPRLDTDAVGVDLGVWERAIEITTRGALLLARHAIPVDGGRRRRAPSSPSRRGPAPSASRRGWPTAWPRPP